MTAILHCGNITFLPDNESDSCSMDKTHSSLTAARLLGMKYEDFVDALTSRDIMAGSEVIRSPLDKASNEKACEALMKAMYGGTFDYIVEMVNENNSRQNNGGAGGGHHRLACWIN